MGGAPEDPRADPRQLDLFVDGRDALLIHEVVTGLIRRDVERTETGLRHLAQDHPRHPDLVALTVLAEALTPATPVTVTHVGLTDYIGLTERTLVPAARRLLGAHADAFLRPVWRALGASAADLPFDATHPQAHRAWLCQQYGEWTAVGAAVEDEPHWADTPLLRYWMGLAQHHLGQPETAIRLWLPLCWMEPVLFAGRAPTLPSAVLRDGWEAFERAASFDEWLADTTDATGWFPAWLLLRHRGLRHLFHSDDIPDAGNVARVFRHLLALLPLEQSGLTDELVRQRRTLRQLDDRFFRYYMAVLADRRASS